MIPETFHFLRPLWLLALLPAAAIVLAARRAAVRGSAWQRVVDAHLLRHLLIDGDGARRRWPLAALALGWAAAAIALAGPTWERIAQPTFKTVQPTVVLLDTSPAMDVADLSPSRLTHARHKLQDILAATQGGQVALVLYADEPFVAAPLTDDGRVIAEMLPSLTPGVMPGSGSRPERAIAQAEALLDQAGVPGGRIVLLTATAGDDPSATAAAARGAASRGREVSVLGLGTAEGAPLVDARGRTVKDAAGAPVLAKVDVAALSALAASGGGSFALATADDADVRRVVPELPPASLASDVAPTGAQADTWRDAGVYLIAIPLLLAPLAFRRGWLAAIALAALLAPASPSHAATWNDLWATPDQQGHSAFAQGRTGEAAELFSDPSWKAAAEYESGAFDAAAQRYAALEGFDSRYNEGNALARSGKLEQAIAAYDRALAERPGDEDATFNRDLVKKLLEQQKQQEQQAKQGGGQGQPQQQGGQGEHQEQSQREPSGHAGQQDRQQGGEGRQDAAQQQEDRQKNAGAQQGAQEQQGTDASPGERGQQEPQDQAQRDAQAGSSNGEPQAGSEARAAAGAQNHEQQPQGPQEDQQAQESSQDSGEQNQRAAAAGQTDERRSDEARSGDAADQQQAAAARDEKDAEPERGESLADRVTRALSGEPKEEPAARPEQQAQAGSSAHHPTTEEEQAREQKLRRVPDDPGGLLRARIRRHFAEQALAQQ